MYLCINVVILGETVDFSGGREYFLLLLGVSCGVGRGFSTQKLPSFCSLYLFVVARLACVHCAL